MHSHKIFSLIVVCLCTFSLSMKINIVDEDYIEVLVGNPPVAKKLLIDPVAPFSYMLSDFNSTTTQTYGTHSFKNVFGTFEGRWEKDFFYLTSDKTFALPLKFLKVTKTNSILKADGVIGLGYSKKIDEECSIYSVMQKMKDVFKIEKVMSYDKAKKLLTIGEFPAPDNYNPVKYPVFEGDESDPSTFVNISQIRAISNSNKNVTYINVNATAKLGLMPVIIAPKTAVKNLEENYYQFVEGEGSKRTTIHDKEKFFSDVFFSENNKDTKTEIIFGKIAYKYDHTDEKDGKFRSAIRIGDAEENPLNFWYIGIDLLNVHRADFNYNDENNATVILYSPTAYDIFGSKAYILVMFVIFAIVFCTILGAVVRCLCSKKRQSEIKKGEELLEL